MGAFDTVTELISNIVYGVCLSIIGDPRGGSMDRQGWVFASNILELGLLLARNSVTGFKSKLKYLLELVSRTEEKLLFQLPEIVSVCSNIIKAVRMDHSTSRIINGENRAHQGNKNNNGSHDYSSCSRSLNYSNHTIDHTDKLSNSSKPFIRRSILVNVQSV